MHGANIEPERNKFNWITDIIPSFFSPYLENNFIRRNRKCPYGYNEGRIRMGQKSLEKSIIDRQYKKEKLHQRRLIEIII